MLERDLRNLSSAYKLDEVPRLLRVLAAQAANIFVAERTGKKLALNKRTVQAYTELLETVFLIHRVPAWRPGLGARELQKPKVYFVDTGLLADQLGANEDRVANDQQIVGKMLENFVGVELLKQLTWAKVRAQLYHYRRDIHEVDVVIEDRSGKIVAGEVKAAASIDKSDYRELESLREARGDSFRAGVLFYTGAQSLPLGDRLWALPISALWA